MSNLSEENVDFVIKKINGSKIESKELKEDLIDHFCCAIEEGIKKGLSLEKAYDKAFQKICPDGLDEIQRETLFLLTSKKNKAMKRLLYLSGYLTTIAITTAIYLIIFQSRHIPGSSIILALGILLLTFLFLPSLFLNLYKRQLSKTFANKMMYVSGFIGLFFLFVSILFKIQHWAYASYPLIASVALINFALFPFLFFKMYRKA
jgi:hypothetical protein